VLLGAKQLVDHPPAVPRLIAAEHVDKRLRILLAVQLIQLRGQMDEEREDKLLPIALEHHWRDVRLLKKRPVGVADHL
jgi:hypothetical protein